MSINPTVTTADRDNARTTIRAILLETDPTRDVSVGGVIDSVITEGNVDVAVQNQANVDAAYLQQQMKAIAEGTVTISDEQMDSLASNYYITRNPDEPAFGDVNFIVQSLATYTIPSGYRIRYGDSSYITEQAFIIYPAGTPGVDFSDGTSVRLDAIYDTATGYSYRFTLPFVCEQANADGVRVSGDVFIADVGFTGLGRIEAAESFDGGTSLETNAEMAQRIMVGLVIKTLGGGQDQISALAASVYAGMQVSAVGVESAMQTRGRINPFGINTGGKLDVYGKSGAVSRATRVIGSAVVTNVGTREVTLTLTREQAAGSYDYEPVGLTGVSGMTGTIATLSEAFSQATLTGFNPEMQAQDLRASANVVVTIVITDTRQKPDLSYVVPITTLGQQLPDYYGVVVDFMPGVLEMADSFYADAMRPPGIDVLVKAGAPCTVTMGISASKPPNYNGPNAASLSAQIAFAINQLPMRQKALDDYTISQIIKDASSQLTLVNLAMTGAIFAFDGTSVSVAQSGNKLTIPTNSAKKVSYETVFFTTTTALVTVNLV
jgi:hypothetical protein